jgi:hypothetical protein
MAKRKGKSVAKGRRTIAELGKATMLEKRERTQ